MIFVLLQALRVAFVAGRFHEEGPSWFPSMRPPNSSAALVVAAAAIAPLELSLSVFRQGHVEAGLGQREQRQTAINPLPDSQQILSRAPEAVEFRIGSRPAIQLLDGTSVVPQLARLPQSASPARGPAEPVGSLPLISQTKSPQHFSNQQLQHEHESPEGPSAKPALAFQKQPVLPTGIATRPHELMCPAGTAPV